MDHRLHYYVEPMRGSDDSITILYKDPTKKPSVLKLLSRYGSIQKIVELKVRDEYKEVIGGLKLNLETSDQSAKAINDLYNKRRPFSTLIQDHEIQNYYEFAKLVLEKDPDNTSTASESEVEAEEEDEVNNSNSDDNAKNFRPDRQLKPKEMEDRDRRLHFLVPFGWTRTMANRSLSKFGPIDYIIYMPMKKIEGFMGVVKFIYALDAQSALKNPFCIRDLKARLGDPRVCKAGEKAEDRYERHRVCGFWITKREKENHIEICNMQRGANYKCHWACGGAVRLRDWEQHLQECEPFTIVRDPTPEIRPLIHFLKKSRNSDETTKNVAIDEISYIKDLEGLCLEIR